MSNERIVLRYSEAFKRKVVEDLEKGVVDSISAAQRRYGIGGKTTVKKWLRRFGKNHLLGKVVRVETADERHEIERLRKQVRELEHALAQTRMKELLSDAHFECLCEKMGIKDIEGEKKKVAAELSKRRERGSGKGTGRR